MNPKSLTLSSNLSHSVTQQPHHHTIRKPEAASMEEKNQLTPSGASLTSGDNSMNTPNFHNSKEIDELSSGSSSNGVKNGSGNWGWFEDVHAPENNNDKNTDDTSSDGESKTRISGKDNRKLGLFRSFAKPLEEVFTPGTDNDSSVQAVTAPTYVLEESRSSQKLWKHTAGNRPPQPVEERAFFENMWAANFSQSQVVYHMPMEVLTASSPFFLSPFADSTFADNDNDGVGDYNLAAPFNTNVTTRMGKVGNEGTTVQVDRASEKEAEADAAEATLLHGILRSAGTGKGNYSLKSMGPHHHHHTLVNKKINGGNCDMTVLVRGDNVFGTTVSKSFIKKNIRRANGRPETVSVSISIGSYRVVESKKHGKYAQFLVIYCEGNFKETIGVWKRHSDFDELSGTVTAGHESCASFHPLAITEDHDHEMLPNAMTSWRLLKKRQRWYRCLDAGYLSLKIFLLERFLHDILFESSSPQILRDFVGVDAVSQ